MKFIEDDQYHIIMDRPELGAECPYPGCESYSIKLDELKLIADLGIRIIYEPLQWHKAEPSKGTYDWTMADDLVERPRKAGMKVLILVPNSVPLWMPNDWYVQERNGKPMKNMVREGVQPIFTWGCLSPWCKEAQDYQENFIRMVKTRYESNDVLCINSLCRVAETILPPGGTYLFDPHAVKNYREFVSTPNVFPDALSEITQSWMYITFREMITRQQKIFVDHPSREIFMALHPVFKQWLNTGNKYMEEYADMLLTEVRPDCLNWILYSYFTPGTEGETHLFAKRMATKGIKCFVGSELPEGLPVNTPRLLQEEIRGFITSPIHEFARRKNVTRWMLDYLRESRQLIINNRKNLTI